MTDASSSLWSAGLEDAARRALPLEVFRYFSQGSRDGTTAAEAAAAWQRYRFVPRVFADVRKVDLSTSFLGTPATMPAGVAPTTFQRAADPGGEVAMAEACRDVGVPVVVSSNAAASFVSVGAVGAQWWLQAYLTEDRDLVVPMLDAAVAAGAAAIVLTVDTPVVATKYDGGAIWRGTPPEWVRANLGPHADAAKARDLAATDVAWLRQRTGLPVVVKGVLHPDDAVAAVDAGGAAVWVSNHGGRQLDRVVPTALALPAIVDRISGRAPVYVDGGVRSGLDVLTALALGADACFLGRWPLYALADGGSAAVHRLFTTLAAELTEALRLAGASSARTLGERLARPQFGL